MTDRFRPGPRQLWAAASPSGVRARTGAIVLAGTLTLLLQKGLWKIRRTQKPPASTPGASVGA
ncbi:hypothetical protein ACFWOQ_06580 [Streptomyces rubiginosohelvolus]|uniref:Uncharacterized protein n=1 Tax=Streptomyces rubiginosohelvolus TaxID=67362 RepID=A0ABW6EVA2_9ACTN